MKDKLRNASVTYRAQGRPVVRRRQGCAELATDAVVQLCAGHLAAYEHGTARSVARAGKPGRKARA
ncbi:MAG TPA: hypothetical protein VN786_07565 [Acidimicrobiales bacterium]|nr:hypothetical protein [Acidimicrobiales bacterium]